MTSEYVTPASGAGRPTISYYHRNGVVVTNRYLTAGAYRYEITELNDLRQARGSTHPGVMVGLVIAVAEAAFVAPFVGLLRSPLAWLVTITALAIPCLVGAFCARRWPAQYELLADYRGRQVIIFSTRDEREFGQVARSVRRAVEAAYRH
ncbi:MAG TPA: DUF6232 family protein [Rugosimonospora sp.]|nr:DUF6232 family protein [Rugosimonospora sp.]